MSVLMVVIRIFIGIAFLGVFALSLRFLRIRWRRIDNEARDAERQFEMTITRQTTPATPAGQGTEDFSSLLDAFSDSAPASPSPRMDAAIAAATTETAKSAPVQAIFQKLEIAGLAADSGESVAAPGAADPAIAVRLKNRKTMLIAPPDCDSQWLEAQLCRYDYVCRTGLSGAGVWRRFEDFLADQMILD